MKITIKKKLLRLVGCFMSFSNESHLFIIAQARSGSSLLMHILCSNDEILGFGEEFTIFKNEDDLNNSAHYIRLKNFDFFKPYKYLAHQITANNRTPNIELLAKKNVKNIILVRNPESVIKSMSSIAKKNYADSSEKEIINYYINRLKFQKSLFNNLPEESRLLLRYEDLLSNSETALNELADFLKLKTPLKSKYKLQKFTQISGDPSIHILSGSIKPTPEYNLEINSNLLKIADLEYQTFFQDIKNYNERKNE